MPERTQVKAGARLVLPKVVTDTLQAEVSAVAKRTLQAIIVDVPSYADAFSGEMGRTIENAVRLALGTFLDTVSEGKARDLERTMRPALGAAHELGRGEARGGRSMEALLSAYRIGARVAWRDFASASVAQGVEAGTIAEFAELVFAYIDELSATSAAGHADELARTGRVRQRYLDRLAQSLLNGAPADALTASAERAQWKPPTMLTAVLLPTSMMSGLLNGLDDRTLHPTEAPPGLETSEDVAVLLVPEGGTRLRKALLRQLRDRGAYVGPARPWTQVRSSYVRALRAHDLNLAVGDTDDHLTELVLAADQDALADLRARVLAPLAELRPSAVEKLTETLRAWLLHHGRREEIAAALFVHAQTVRYRMGQLREVYADRLDDPQFVLDATVALGVR